jgi:hypothetical protein
LNEIADWGRRPADDDTDSGVLRPVPAIEHQHGLDGGSPTDRGIGRPMWAAAALLAVVGVGALIVTRPTSDPPGEGTSAGLVQTGVPVDPSLEASFYDAGTDRQLAVDLAEIDVFDLCTDLDDPQAERDVDELAQARSGVLDLLAEIRSTREEVLSSIETDPSLSEEQRSQMIEEQSAYFDSEEARAEQQLAELEIGPEWGRQSPLPADHEAHVAAGSLVEVRSTASNGASAHVVTSPDGISACVIEPDADGYAIARAHHETARPGERLLPRTLNVVGAIEMPPEDGNRTPWLVFGATDDDIESVVVFVTGTGEADRVDAVVADQWWVAVLYGQPTDDLHSPRFDLVFQVTTDDGESEEVIGGNPTIFSVWTPPQSVGRSTLESDREPVAGLPGRTAGDVKPSCINVNSDWLHGEAHVRGHLENLREVVGPPRAIPPGTFPAGRYVHDVLFRDEIRNYERLVEARSGPVDQVAMAITDLVRTGRVVVGPETPAAESSIVMVSTPDSVAYCTVDRFGSISWAGQAENVFSTDPDDAHPEVYARYLGQSGNNGESIWGLHGFVGPDLDSVVVTTGPGQAPAVVQDGWWSAVVAVEESEIDLAGGTGPAGEAPFALTVEARFADGSVRNLG